MMSLHHKGLTSDEPLHYEYGYRVLNGAPERTSALNSSTMPFSSVHAMTSINLAVLVRTAGLPLDTSWNGQITRGRYAAIALSLFVVVELTSKGPLLNLRLLVRRNFGFGILANFLLGTALYGSVFILPLYLARIQGYNSEQIGFVLAWTGLPQLMLIPLVPRLMQQFDARIVIALGFALFAASNFLNVHMTLGTAADQLLWPNVMRAVGQALVFAPLSAVATAGIEPANAGSASALFNMTRNLGGAIGIAVLQTFQSKREQFHSNILTSSISLFEEATRNRIDELTTYFLNSGLSDVATAHLKAIVAMALRVRQQANIMAFSDTFYLLGVALILALVATLLLKKPGHLEAGGAH